MDGSHLFKMLPGNVTYAQQPGPARIAFGHHRSPDFSVRPGPTVLGRGTVKNVGINILRTEMLERTGHRLRDLSGQIGRRIVREPMVLTGHGGEFGLQKEVFAPDHVGCVGGSQRCSHSGFEVVPTLVSRVYAAEAHAESKLGEGLCAVFLPRRSIKKRRIGHRLICRHCIGPLEQAIICDCHQPATTGSCGSCVRER